MFYVYPNGSSGWSISVEPPVNQEYYEFETLPDGDGTIVYRDGELVRVLPVEPVPTPDPGPTPSGVEIYSDIAKAIREGVDSI